MPASEIEHLARHAQAGAERGAAKQHDHRLQRERHRREGQRDADLRGGSRQRGDEQHGRDPDRRSTIDAGDQVPSSVPRQRRPSPS